MRRRQFLAGGAALGAGVALDPLRRIGGEAEARETSAGDLEAHVPFDGAHQAGIVTERPLHATFLALDSVAGTGADLRVALQALTIHARALASGHPAPLGGPNGDGPTPDSGLLGTRVTPESLTVTISFGASLFDGRYALSVEAPKRLKPMTTFPDDQLVPGQTHGDLMVQICADTREKAIHTTRDLMRATRPWLAPRWKVDGFLPDPARESGAGRNLLGFKDGSSNPDTSDAALMDRLVWASDDEPRWARGGTYQVVRVIRNRVEFWDRVGLAEQELMIGRDKAKGAPLGQSAEQDDPDFRSDPHGARIPLDAHIRLARPRTPQTEDSRILRRSYNYSRGVDSSGQLDMGLVFVAYQRDPERQFEAVQKRLAGEPLVDYVVPTGGGYFFVPPGTRDTRDWIGSALFA
jgi:deferrochelatase/peroxidase EfeB